MATLDLRPQTVDVYGYAGDTLEIGIVVQTEYINGRTFSAQVRPAVGSVDVSATFEVTPPADVNGPAYIRLPSSVTRELAQGTGTLVRTRTEGVTSTVMRFSGVWDCQLSLNGSDPVKTVAKGALYIDMDVTEETVIP